jgi:hypothetical protein
MDPLDPTAIGQSQREQQINDEFYSYITSYADGHSFRNHSLKTRHNESCAFRMDGTYAPCSCCAGAMTFQTAESFVNEVCQPQLREPVTVGDTAKSPPTMLQRISFSTMLGIMNIKQMFGFPTTKAALNASFGTGEDASAEGSIHGNVLWGTNGVISGTLRYWGEGIVSMYSEIVRLRADVCTWQRKASEARKNASKAKLKRKAAEQRLKAAVKRAEGHIKTARPWPRKSMQP